MVPIFENFGHATPLLRFAFVGSALIGLGLILIKSQGYPGAKKPRKDVVA